MKAVTFDRYCAADGLQLSELAQPVASDDCSVLVRIKAASINALDWHFMTGLPYLMRMMTGLGRPKTTRLGADLAGVVAEVGSEVTRFQVGDEVFGEVAESKPGMPELGTLAEYICVTEDCLVPKPPGLSFEQVAAVPVAALTALQLLRDLGQVSSGQQVLINGASGGVGTFAVQVAKSFGAEVTGVCSSGNVETTRSIGADHVFDYSQEDFSRSGQRYDVLLDNVGNRSLTALRRVLKPKAVYISSFGRPENLWSGPMVQMMQMSLLSPFVSQKLGTMVASPSQSDLLALKDLLDEGKLKPVIDRTYPLSEVKEAMVYFAEGHAKGKVVLTM